MDDPQAIVRDLRRCAPEVFSRYPVLFAYLYGSVAEGGAHAFSDLDIGVCLDEEARGNSLAIELDLGLDLDAALGHRVETDVRSVHALPLAVLGRMLVGGELLYCRDDLRRVDFEVRTRLAYFDFLPAIQRHHAEYLAAVLQRFGGSEG